MAEENKELNLSDLGLEEEETPAEKVQKNEESNVQKENITKTIKTPDNEIKVITPEIDKSKEIPQEIVESLKKKKIDRPPRDMQITNKPKNTVKRGGQQESSDGYTVLSINQIAKNPVSKPKDPIRSTLDNLYELTDNGINRTKNELTAPGGRIDEAKHKYIDHQYAILDNRAKNNVGLQNHIKAVNDIINTDARFDGITDYERKAYILYKVAKDNETGISDESFGIMPTNDMGPRRSSADVSKDIDRVIKNRQEDDDEYLLDDDKAFILDDNGSNFAFKDDNIQKKEENFMDNKEIITENDNSHLPIKEEPVANNEIQQPTEEIKPIKKPVENKVEEPKNVQEVKPVENKVEQKPIEKEEPKNVKPAENKKEEPKNVQEVKPVENKVEQKPVKKEEPKNVKPAENKVEQKPVESIPIETNISENEMLTAEMPEYDKSTMIEEETLPEDETLNDEKKQQNQKEFAQSVINMLELNKTHDLDGFDISESINLNTAISSQRRAPMTVKWGLQYTGTAFEMTPFSGEEIIQFSQDNTDFTSISGLRTIFSNIYRHLIIPNKPSFEAWLRQTSDYDVESLFFGVYISCFKDNNFLTYECPNKSCGKIYIEKRKIEDMVVYPNKETEERFKKILKGDTVSSKLYRTRPVPISDKYAIGFVTQSIWSNLFEPTALSKETANQYSTVVNLMPQIDKIYLIDRENKKLRPINFGVVNNSLSGTVLKKVKGLHQIFRTFSMDERTKTFIEISKITSSFNTDRIRYQIPESTCPKCGTKIPAATHTPLDLLFIRSQLPIAAVSMQELA